MIKFISRVSIVCLVVLSLLLTISLQGEKKKTVHLCESEENPCLPQSASDIEAAITNQWGDGAPPIKICGRDAAVGEVVTAPLKEYDEKFALRAFEDPLPVHSACPGYGYFRDADMSVISRITLGNWRDLILIRHAGGRGNYPGSEGYIQLVGEYYLVEVLTAEAPDNSYFGFGLNIDEENGRIEWQGRGGCPACACLENDVKIALVVERLPLGPDYTPFTSTRSTAADIEASVSTQWGHGAPPIKIFGQDAAVGQVVTDTLNEYDEKYALRAFEDPKPVFRACPGYGYIRDGDMSVISRITLGNGRVLVLVMHVGARGYHPGSEGYVQVGNDWYIEKIVSAGNDPSWYGYGVRIDQENGTIEWQGRTMCPACACHEGTAFISVVAAKRTVEKLEATVDIHPNTLNRKSKGRWVTAYIELPEGYNVEDIDMGALAVTAVDEDPVDEALYAQSSPTSIGDYDSDGIPDLMVKFSRSALIELLSPGERIITVSGSLEDETAFEGNDTLTVIH
jgi:hypothetical protein